MQIYVGKNGQQLGPFSLEEVNLKLADRTFAGTDLAWHEGAAGWAPLSSVAGVVIPAATPAAIMPAAVPIPAPTVTPAPAAASVPLPVRSNASIVQPPASPKAAYKTPARIGWVLLGVTLIMSCIPILGCGTWILVWPVAIAAIVLGIVVMTRGGTGQGIGLIVASIVLVPLALLAPIFSTALLGNKQERQYETQIMENLRTIDGAKGQWTKTTQAPAGLEVTMVNLTTYLSGREIKPVVEERYDPSPVGQPPTATLPANKSLGGFKAGEALTIAGIEKDLASGSFSWMSKRTTTGPSPTPIVVPAMSPKLASTPAPLSPPASTPSPSPAASPKSTSSPRSLIAPRSSEPPAQPPGPRRPGPSPSAKFAPRDNPRTGPRESPSRPADSTGPRQGKQYPGESPAPSPNDDDDD
jgi:hypothetical protein